MKATLVVMCLMMVGGCTEQQRARTFGGDSTIRLEVGRELVVATWKNDDLWYLTRPRKSGETIDTLIFQESSSFGVLNGSVTFIEQ